MLNGKLHLFFHSELDNPQLWRIALSEQLGELHFSTADNCTKPDTVDIALLWTAPSNERNEVFKALNAIGYHYETDNPAYRLFLGQ